MLWQIYGPNPSKFLDLWVDVTSEWGWRSLFSPLSTWAVSWENHHFRVYFCRPCLIQPVLSEILVLNRGLTQFHDLSELNMKVSHISLGVQTFGLSNKGNELLSAVRAALCYFCKKKKKCLQDTKLDLFSDHRNVSKVIFSSKLSLLSFFSGIIDCRWGKSLSTKGRERNHTLESRLHTLIRWFYF